MGVGAKWTVFWGYQCASDVKGSEVTTKVLNFETKVGTGCSERDQSMSLVQRWCKVGWMLVRKAYHILKVCTSSLQPNPPQTLQGSYSSEGIFQAAEVPWNPQRTSRWKGVMVERKQRPLTNLGCDCEPFVLLWQQLSAKTFCAYIQLSKEVVRGGFRFGVFAGAGLEGCWSAGQSQEGSKRVSKVRDSQILRVSVVYTAGALCLPRRGLAWDSPGTAKKNFQVVSDACLFALNQSSPGRPIRSSRGHPD
jgi:hypothetical protein